MEYKNMRCGLIGEHLGHSFSKIIHAEIADYSYELCELVPDELEAFVKEGGLDAFNVTIPYKKAVMPFLDRISDEALRIGAVNTVVRRADGSLDGYNTDYYGFCGMIDALGIVIKGKKAIVFGNGGASLTVQAVLADRDVGETVVITVKGENNYENLYKHYDADIIVNATPVGMYPKNGEKLAELSNFKNCRAVFDVIYNPSKTALLLDAEKLGIPHINGLYMLVAQAVKAYEYFTGQMADCEIIERIVEKIQRDTKNVILIGMPGCGKSTVGALIGKILGRDFLDADVKFTETYGVPPAETINTLGEDRFREMERDILSKLCRESGKIIACGGGVVTREFNYPLMHQNGVIVYVKRELSKLSTEGRPLSQAFSVEALYEKRKAAYERFADVTVECTEIPELTARCILDALGFDY